MYASLSSIDIIAKKEGRRTAVQLDARTRAEIEADPAYSAAFALIRLVAPTHYDPDFDVVYALTGGDAPDFLLEIVAAAGAKFGLARAELHLDPPPRPLSVLMTQAMKDVAEWEARRLSSPLNDDLLNRLEEEAGAAGLSEDLEEPYWRAVIGLAAVAGELIRSEFGGEWRPEPEVDLAFGLEVESMRINLIGKGIKFLADPVFGGDSLLGLVSAVRHMINEKRATSG